MKLFKKAMDGAQAAVWVVVILAAVYLFAQYQTPGAGVPSADEEPVGSVTPGKIPCPYAPTVKLTAQDKHDSSVDVDSGTWKYILNTGGASTDADGGFEVTKGDILKVLVADANSSTHYRALWEVPIDKCGLNSLLYKDVVKFTKYASKCYNEDGDPINGTTYTNANLSIGVAGSRNVKCELEGVADTGTPYGGMMILEFNQSTYKKEDLNKLTLGGAWASSTVTPESSTVGAYSVGVAGATTRSFKVPAIVGTGTYTWVISTVQAKDSINPGEGGTSIDTAYGDGIFGRIYPINCFEEEDVTPSVFKCALTDMDDTFMSPGGTTKGTGSITDFVVNVK